MHKASFTLIELLVVIAVLVVVLSITLVAINPLAQLKKANDAKRISDARSIGNAIQQYSINGTLLPVGINGATIPQYPFANLISKTALDICSLLIPDYIAELPRDPALGKSITDCSSPYDSGYYAYIDSQNRPTIVALGLLTNDIAPVAGVTTYASDTFNRTVSGAWDSANTGGNWAVNTPADSNVASGVGSFNNNTQHEVAELPTVSALNVTEFVRFKIEKLGVGAAGSALVYLAGRRQASGYEYRIKVFVLGGSGRLQLQLSKLDPTESNIGSAYTTAYTLVPNTWYRLRGQITGTNPTTLSGRMWLEGDAEPTSWQATGTDSEATLQTAGKVKIGCYQPTFTNRPINYSFDNFIALY